MPITVSNPVIRKTRSTRSWVQTSRSQPEWLRTTFSHTVLLGGAHGEVHGEAPLSVVAAVHGLVTRQGC